MTMTENDTPARPATDAEQAAFRAGAEAMREKAAQCADDEHKGYLLHKFPQEALACMTVRRAIRALPVPPAPGSDGDARDD